MNEHRKPDGVAEPALPRPRRGPSPWRDPTGKRALFEAPVSAAPDSLAPGRAREGREALFSVGPPRVGTAVVECEACGGRIRVSLADLGVRLAMVSAWLPIRRHAHWMRCPSCEQRTWCRIGWRE